MAVDLIGSARRMYQSQYATVDKSEVANAIVQAGANIGVGLVKVGKKIKEKKKANEENFEAKASAILKMTKDPEARRKLQAVLDKGKEEFAKGNQGSYGIFKGKKAKQEAAELMNEAMSDLDAWASDAAYYDVILNSSGKTFSKANSVAEGVNDVILNDAKVAQNFEYNPEGKDPGIYTRDAITGDLVRLSDYKAPLQVWEQGVEQSSGVLTHIANRAKIGDNWDGKLKQELQTAVNKLSNHPDFMSLLFDDIADFNFADAYLASKGETFENEGDRKLRLEELKEEYRKDPTALKEEWKRLMMDEGKERFDENPPKKAADSTGRPRSFKPDFADFAAKVTTGQPTLLSIVSDKDGDKYRYVTKKDNKYFITDKFGTPGDAAKEMTEEEFKIFTGLPKDYDLKDIDTDSDRPAGFTTVNYSGTGISFPTRTQNAEAQALINKYLQ